MAKKRGNPELAAKWSQRAQEWRRLAELTEIEQVRNACIGHAHMADGMVELHA